MTCDVHVITLDGDREDWLNDCLHSLESEPVIVHRINGIRGHIGKGRAAGFRLGSSPYVSFVDSDDYVHAGAFDRAITYLETHPEKAAVCSNEQVISETGDVLGYSNYSNYYPEMIQGTYLLHLHHLLVVRREAIEPYFSFIEDIPQYCEFCLWAEMMYDGHVFGHIEDVDYTWRRRANSANRTIACDPKHGARFKQRRKALLEREAHKLVLAGEQNP